MITHQQLAPSLDQPSSKFISERLPLWHWLCLALVCVPVLLFRLDTYPALWFDEGYKLNAVRTLAERSVYGTYTVSGFIPFDPGTSSGPLDTGAMAISARLFGMGIVQTRLVSVLFTLVTVYSLYAIAVYLWGKQAALFSLLFLAAFPIISDTGFLHVGRQVLSEPTQLATMVFGFYLAFRAIESRSFWRSLMAGIIMGTGILTKTQVAIGLVPALVAVGVIRGWFEKHDRRGWAILLAPATGIVLVYVSWSLFAAASTPPEIRTQNSALLMDAVRSNLLTDMFGSGINSAAALVNTFILLGAGSAFYRVMRARSQRFGQTARPAALLTDRQWAEITLAGFALFLSIWHVWLSIGWPRYAYAGLVIALFLLGRTLWGAYQRFSFWERGYRTAIILLALMALASNLLPILREPPATDVQDAAAYIAQNIPSDAVIETWEWELDALSGHWQMHHPPQQYLFLAIRQFARDLPFALGYNPLAGDPDYIVLGRMSDWTNLYSDTVIRQHFTPVASFGIYRIYRRTG